MWRLSVALFAAMLLVLTVILHKNTNHPSVRPLHSSVADTAVKKPEVLVFQRAGLEYLLRDEAAGVAPKRPARPTKVKQ